MRKPGSILLILFAAAFCSNKNFAQSQKFYEKDTSQVAGNWTGSSTCQVKNSSCRDELIEFNILKADSELYHVAMNKIVNGKISLVAVVDCAYDDETKTLSTNDNGKIWQLTMNHTTIDGILIWHQQLYKKIHLEKK